MRTRPLRNIRSERPKQPHFTLKLKTIAKQIIVFLACWRLISSQVATGLIQRGGLRDA
jgi:hypothetical protein